MASQRAEEEGADGFRVASMDAALGADPPINPLSLLWHPSVAGAIRAGWNPYRFARGGAPTFAQATAGGPPATSNRGRSSLPFIPDLSGLVWLGRVAPVLADE